jgi:anti-anti-sigma regulatory factor
VLRITIHDSPSEFRLHLEGRLAGPWVRELDLCWQTAQSTVCSRAVIVDLRDVDFIDSAGERLLAAVHQHGAKLLATSPMMKHLVAEITGEPEETG